MRAILRFKRELFQREILGSELGDRALAGPKKSEGACDEGRGPGWRNTAAFVGCGDISERCFRKDVSAYA